MAVSLIKNEPTDDGGTQPSPPPQTSNAARRRSSVEAPPPRFQLRRQNASTNSNTPGTWITQRGATDEIREHLKHLGPSNLASRPRQTRYHNVKIKRRSTSPARSAQTDYESSQSASDIQRPLLTGYQGGIGAGLVGSGAEAKDGAHALRLGYGTIESPDSATKGTSAQQYKELAQVSIPEAVHEERDDHLLSNSTREGSSGTGSIHSSDFPPGSVYHRPGPTRSGSITEQIVDVNGIRKVVLHTTNGSSSEEESPPHKDTDDLIRL